MNDETQNVSSEENAETLNGSELNEFTNDCHEAHMIKTVEIEDMISQFGDIEDERERSYKSFLFASFAWSFKFKLARSIIRLLDQNAGMADAQERNQPKRVETLEQIIRRTETQIDELQNLYNWSADQTKKELVPDNEYVIKALQVEQTTPVDEIHEYATMMGISLEEAKAELDSIPDDGVEKAIAYADSALEELVQRTSGQYETDFVISSWNAVSMMEKISEKAAIYAQKSKQLWRQTAIPKKKAHLIANIKAFESVMNNAYDKSLRYRDDAEQETAKAQELASAAHEGSNAVMA